MFNKDFVPQLVTFQEDNASVSAKFLRHSATRTFALLIPRDHT
jgi:hypothetical protein